VDIEDDDNDASSPPPPPASAGPTIEDRLNRLKRLRDKQDITPEEYEAKRRKILDEI
jgi:Short C-terminal domain